MNVIYQETEGLDQFLKIVEVAEILNISRAFAYKLIQQGNLRYVKIEGTLRVRMSDLTGFIKRNLSPLS